MRRGTLSILNILIVRCEHACLLSIARRLGLTGVNWQLVRLVQNRWYALSTLLILRIRAFPLTIAILACICLNLVESLLRASFQAAVARPMASDYLAIAVWKPAAPRCWRVWKRKNATLLIALSIPQFRWSASLDICCWIYLLALALTPLIYGSCHNRTCLRFVPIKSLIADVNLHYILTRYLNILGIINLAKLLFRRSISRRIRLALIKWLRYLSNLVCILRKWHDWLWSKALAISLTLAFPSLIWYEQHLGSAIVLLVQSSLPVLDFIRTNL